MPDLSTFGIPPKCTTGKKTQPEQPHSSTIPKEKIPPTTTKKQTPPSSTPKRAAKRKLDSSMLLRSTKKTKLNSPWKAYISGVAGDIYQLSKPFFLLALGLAPIGCNKDRIELIPQDELPKKLSPEAEMRLIRSLPPKKPKKGKKLFFEAKAKTTVTKPSSKAKAKTTVTKPSSKAKASSKVTKPSSNVEAKTNVTKPSSKAEASTKVTKISSYVEAKTKMTKPSSKKIVPQEELSNKLSPTTKAPLIQPPSPIITRMVTRLASKAEARTKVTKPSLEAEARTKVTKPSFKAEVGTKVTKPSSEAEVGTKLTKPSTKAEAETKVTKPSTKIELRSRVTKLDKEQMKTQTLSSVKKALTHNKQTRAKIQLPNNALSIKKEPAKTHINSTASIPQEKIVKIQMDTIDLTILEEEITVPSKMPRKGCHENISEMLKPYNRRMARALVSAKQRTEANNQSSRISKAKTKINEKTQLDFAISIRSLYLKLNDAIIKHGGVNSSHETAWHYCELIEQISNKTYNPSEELIQERLKKYNPKMIREYQNTIEDNRKKVKNAQSRRCRAKKVLTKQKLKEASDFLNEQVEILKRQIKSWSTPLQ